MFEIHVTKVSGVYEIKYSSEQELFFFETVMEEPSGDVLKKRLFDYLGKAKIKLTRINNI
jgi:hypothetical protein